MLVEEQRDKPDSWLRRDGQWVQAVPLSRTQRLATAEQRIRELEKALADHHAGYPCPRCE